MSNTRSTSAGKRKSEPQLPPHRNAKPHAAVMKKLKKMTRKQLIATLVEAGVYTKSGKLARAYAAPAE